MLLEGVFPVFVPILFVLFVFFDVYGIKKSRNHRDETVLRFTFELIRHVGKHFYGKNSKKTTKCFVISKQIITFAPTK